jgi:hypothetical protein
MMVWPKAMQGPNGMGHTVWKKIGFWSGWAAVEGFSFSCWALRVLRVGLVLNIFLKKK